MILDPRSAGLPAVVVVAHDKPRQLRRLIAALDPLPIFLHVDAGTDPATYAAMTDGLPDRVRHLHRLRAGWGRFEVVEAELSGLRAALRETDATHVLTATGADYPLMPTDRLVEWLAARQDHSYAEVLPLPIAEWGPLGGRDRLWFRQRPWRGRRLVWPIPRRIPAGLRAAGGTQTKILSRRHAQRVVDVLDEQPELLRFFRTCWTPDEVLIPTLLSSPSLGFRWDQEGTSAPHPWFIDWGRRPAKNPRWLDRGDLAALEAAAAHRVVPALFARKFADDADDLVDAIDRGLRAPVGSR